MKKGLKILLTALTVLCLLTACGEVVRTEDVIVPEHASIWTPFSLENFVNGVEVKSLKAYACKAVGVGGTVTEISCATNLAVNLVFVVDGISAEGKEIECVLHGVTGTGIAFIADERPYLSSKTKSEYPIVDFAMNVYSNDGSGYVNAADGKPVSEDFVRERSAEDEKTYKEISDTYKSRIDENTIDDALALRDHVVTEADIMDVMPESETIAVSFGDAVRYAAANYGGTHRQFSDGTREESPCTITEIAPIQSFAGNEYYVIVVEREKPIKTESKHFEIMINAVTGQMFYWGQGLITRTDAEARGNMVFGILRNSTSGIYVANAYVLKDGTYESFTYPEEETLTEDSPVFIESRELENTLYEYSVAHCRYRIDKSTIESDMKELMGWKTDSPEEIPDLTY